MNSNYYIFQGPDEHTQSVQKCRNNQQYYICLKGQVRPLGIVLENKKNLAEHLRKKMVTALKLQILKFLEKPLK